jgi:hypothetical protein
VVGRLGIRTGRAEWLDGDGLGKEAEPGQRKTGDRLVRWCSGLHAKRPVERRCGLVRHEAGGIAPSPGGRFRLGDHPGYVGDVPGLELPLGRP